eukprot:UN27522
MMRSALNKCSRATYEELINKCIKDPLAMAFDPESPADCYDIIIKGIEIFPDLTSRLLKSWGYHEFGEEIYHICDDRLIGGSNRADDISIWTLNTTHAISDRRTCIASVSPIEGLACQEFFTILNTIPHESIRLFENNHIRDSIRVIWNNVQWIHRMLALLFFSLYVTFIGFCISKKRNMSPEKDILAFLTLVLNSIFFI